MTPINSSRPPSAAGSAHDSSLPGLSQAGTPAHIFVRTSEISRPASPSFLAINGTDKAADMSAQATLESTPQPTTTSNSISSNPASGLDAGTETGAIYGTRSRNRGGNARPNYAEDRELDVDLEMIPFTKTTGRKSTSKAVDSGVSHTSEPGKSTAAPKKATSDPEQVGMIQSQYKEPIPGTSTFSLNTSAPAAPTTAQASKKRKANGHAAAQAASQHHVTGQPVNRRTSAAQVVVGFRESNMLTFDNCGARLKDKKLVADDGTVLQVNGMSDDFSYIHTLKC